MAQSNLYNSASSDTVADITNDDSRDIGDVDVKTVSEAVDVSDRNGRNLGEVDIPNPIESALRNTDPVTGSTSTAGTDVTLALGYLRQNVDFYVETTGAATLTVEVRVQNGTWLTLDTVDYTAATTQVEQYTTAFEEIRASVDANLTTLTASGKGA